MAIKKGSQKIREEGKLVEMKTKTNFKKGAALMAALIVTGAVTAPVFAAEGVKYTAINGGAVVVEKYLTMDKEASVPNVTQFSQKVHDFSRVDEWFFWLDSVV